MKQEPLAVRLKRGGPFSAEELAQIFSRGVQFDKLEIAGAVLQRGTFPVTGPSSLCQEHRVQRRGRRGAPGAGVHLDHDRDLLCSFSFLHSADVPSATGTKGGPPKSPHQGLERWVRRSYVADTDTAPVRARVPTGMRGEGPDHATSSSCRGSTGASGARQLWAENRLGGKPAGLPKEPCPRSTGGGDDHERLGILAGDRNSVGHRSD